MLEDVLLEIGTEEIPAGYITPALKQMENLAVKLLGDQNIKYQTVTTCGTPRRLVLCIEKINEVQEDVSYEVLGPPKRVAFDEKGNPTPAAVGFARNQGLEVKELTVKQTERGEYIAAVVKKKGRPVKTILPGILSNIITSLSFPKNMRWLADNDLSFARPVRSILALWGTKVIKFQVGKLKSGNKTCGHFIFSPKKLLIKNMKDYKGTLKNNYVMVDQNERKKIIVEQAAKLAAKVGGQPIKDEELVNIVVNLVEYPTLICGSIKKEYLKLPPEVLITSMRTHQKYFALMDNKNNLLPFFITVKNGPSQHMDIVREGNEHVLEARLFDADFFFKQDTKRSPESRVEELKHVVFQEELGTVYAKTERIGRLSEYICREALPAGVDTGAIKRIAWLSKGALVTEMVKEFPELEGVMGRVYASLGGESEKVARGIQEHLLPLSSEGELPGSLEGAIVGLADKIDTIVGDFSVGLLPTGSQDPYGLRRQAHGITRIILDKKINIDLDKLIEETFNQLGSTGYKIKDKEKTKQLVMAFFRDRLQNILLQSGIKYDEVDSVLETDSGNIADSGLRAIAVHKLRTLEDFEPIIVSFKRAKNILKQAEAKIARCDELSVKEEFLEDGTEKELYRKMVEIRDQVLGLIKEADYEKALSAMVGLRKPIDAFFDKVMVMDKDANLRDNRLALLNDIVTLFLSIADFSKIVVEKV
jgi:glycyl-tRNA synthetase beta chain